MPKLYCIPGMGTDQRAFQRLVPLLSPELEVQYLLHQPPAHSRESLRDYADRLRAELPIEGEAPIFLGVSLGGPIAVELARHFPKALVVLISTYKQREEEPVLFKLARKVPLYRWIPYRYTCQVVPWAAHRSGICTLEESQLLETMFRDSNAAHFAWARGAIVHWANDWVPSNHIHINGTRDHIFYRANPQATHLIQGGTHNMILDRAETIATLIHDFLQKKAIIYY